MTTISTITVLSQADAEKHSPRPGEAIISITDPGAPPAALHPGWPEILRIEFGDLEYDQHTIAYWGASWPSVEGVFRAAHAQDIIRFVERIELNPTFDHLVIHCHAGQSRSAAIATWVAARHPARPPSLGQEGIRPSSTCSRSPPGTNGLGTTPARAAGSGSSRWRPPSSNSSDRGWRKMQGGKQDDRAL